MAELPLPIGTYRLPSPEASGRRLVNLYAAIAPPDKPRNKPVHLVRAPGIRSWVDTAQGEVRGAVVMAGTLYVVAGANLYTVSQGGIVAQVTGAAITGNGPVRVEKNGAVTPVLFITPNNGDGFSSNGSTVVQEVSAVFTSGQGGAHVSFLDQYFVFRRRGTAQIFNSGLNAVTFDALDVTTADGAPDNLLGLIVNNREIIAAGETSVERWYNAAKPTGSPFARSPGGFYEIGCGAGDSLANQDNSVAMLANDKTFRRLGATWDRISHDGIDSELQRIPVVADCCAIPYRQEGHHFVAWTLPNAGRTFVIDYNTGEWHERESRIGTVSIGRWRPSLVIDAYGMQIVGDSQSGKLGILDPDTHEEWGEPQVVEWTYQPVYGERLKASHNRLEIGISAGQGAVTGQGSNPLLTLFASDDGGNTYRARPVRSLGVLGDYRKRVVYDNLGESRARGYKCQVSDPCRLFVLDTLLDVTGGRI
ncbi:MAG: hypothetical protein ACREB0_00100 [Sphingopyxis sp.]